MTKVFIGKLRRAAMKEVGALAKDGSILSREKYRRAVLAYYSYDLANGVSGPAEDYIDVPGLAALHRRRKKRSRAIWKSWKQAYREEHPGDELVDAISRKLAQGRRT